VANPIFIVGDAAELGTRLLIKDPGSSEVIGTSVGAVSYIGIGLATGGPVGGAIGGGLYIGGRIIGGVIGMIWK
jgi:hypothetical protein